MCIHREDVYSTLAYGNREIAKVIERRERSKACESCTRIPYSGKFSRVQNFVESPLRAPEEIFAVLIFAVPVHTERRGAIDIALVAIFADPSVKNVKFCTTRKFPAIRYCILYRQVGAPVTEYASY